MLWHYVSTVLPGGFKAQLAATSRLAAVRYREALLAARDELVAEIERLPERLVAAPPTAASTSTASIGASRCWSARCRSST